MDIPFLLALSISSRRVNYLLHFLKCVISRPAPLALTLVGVGVSSSSSFISISSSNYSSKLVKHMFNVS
ncbi:hypothetical protein H5410_041812 [Solanum commersonii]|uniref:Uncharacterized protein n=1 Tax=Solanum commersonii TaxID=4109 RepID=A0A9J5XU71_SOLCO|nr:hypothetical protein H5410_041812 [Solanum commersonii]